MAKYHINHAGNPGVCRAKQGNCPFGGEGNHFKSKEKAAQFADEINRTRLVINLDQKSKFEKIKKGEDLDILAKYGDINTKLEMAKEGKALDLLQNDLSNDVLSQVLKHPDFDYYKYTTNPDNFDRISANSNLQYQIYLRDVTEHPEHLYNYKESENIKIVTDLLEKGQYHPKMSENKSWIIKRALAEQGIDLNKYILDENQYIWKTALEKMNYNEDAILQRMNNYPYDKIQDADEEYSYMINKSNPSPEFLNKVLDKCNYKNNFTATALAVADNCNGDEQILKRLLERYKEDDYMESQLVSKAIGSEAILNSYATSKKRNVREAVATALTDKNNKQLIYLMSSDDSSRVRAIVARKGLNSQKLAKDESVEVRAGVALSGNCHNTLVNDPDPSVRFNVARSSNISKENLRKLAKDEVYYIRAEVAKHPEMSDTMINDPHPRVLANIAKNGKYLSKLADHPDSEVREAVVIHGQSNPEAVEKAVLKEYSRYTLHSMFEHLSKNNPQIIENISNRKDLSKVIKEQCIRCGHGAKFLNEEDVDLKMNLVDRNIGLNKFIDDPDSSVAKYAKSKYKYY